MVLIHAYRIVAASIDRVWDVISDIDRDPDFWRGTRQIKNISKTENTVEREVVIAFILAKNESHKKLVFT